MRRPPSSKAQDGRLKRVPSGTAPRTTIRIFRGVVMVSALWCALELCDFLVLLAVLG